MIDFDRFDFNTTGDKIKITNKHTGDTYTGNRADYAKRVKTGFYASLAIAGIYGLGAGLLIAGKNAHDSRTVRLKRRKTKHRTVGRIANGISRMAFWK